MVDTDQATWTTYHRWYGPYTISGSGRGPEHYWHAKPVWSVLDDDDAVVIDGFGLTYRQAEALAESLQAVWGEEREAARYAAWIDKHVDLALARDGRIRFGEAWGYRFLLGI